MGKTNVLRRVEAFDAELRWQAAEWRAHSGGSGPAAQVVSMSNKTRLPLPIDDVMADIVARVRGEGTLVLEAPPGAGKTTRVPAALVDAGIEGKVVVLEPRRL